MIMITILTAILIGYLLGSIPTGVWLGRMVKGIDVRKHGSGSTGATNVFRVLGAKLAVAVLVVDIAKGYSSCYLASRIDLGDTTLLPVQLAVIGGLAAVLGHLFPLFARFKGGKGIATGAGILLFLSPIEVAFALAIFICVVYLTRYVSLGSILGATFFSSSILLERYYFRYPVSDEIVALSLLLILLVLFTHRSNIKRLVSGTERKFGKKEAGS